MSESTFQPSFLTQPEDHWWSSKLAGLTLWLRGVSPVQKVFGLGYILSLGLSLVGWLQLRQNLLLFDTNISKQLADLKVIQMESEKSASSQPNITSSSAQDVKIVVHLAGAVRKPGVYNLANNSLLVDAVKAAGGLTNLVWQDYLDQSINLAQPLTNNQKIWIPSANQRELIVGSARSGDQTPVLSSNETQSDSPALNYDSEVISINQASKTELMSLAGIGEKRAEDIISNRPYVTIDELASKAKVPTTVVQAIRSQLEL